MNSVRDILLATVWVAALVVIVTNAGGSSRVIESFGGAWFGGLTDLASVGQDGGRGRQGNGGGRRNRRNR